ncbi:hypothetical protein BC835DRAFT_1409889 [Cytidiella melzeri]|nr:hypothetical protein BC835DRAFT_1409889 [Cytidiella melzeri]
MSSSAREDVVDDPKLDELDEAAVEADTVVPAAEPVKRKRGRPPGSKNKKTLAAQAATAGTSTGAGTSGETPVKRGRGRPPKRKSEEGAATTATTADGEPPQKRKRGRPPKAKPAAPPEDASGDDAAEDDGADEAAPKKKRGRTRKDAS